ncbi:hypothetical protein MHYP_G00172440 [Metynnis hypsauchen]
MFTFLHCGGYSLSPSAPPTCALRSAFPASAPSRARSCALIASAEQRDLWSGCRPVYSRLGKPNYTFLRSRHRSLTLNEEVKQS